MNAAVNLGGSTTQNKEELSGFIFMCSGKTKPECYVNRVFGLPARRKNVVEKIKPGTKLFLFDTDVKLLYGVYEAASNGGMNLQPAAFGGRYPAQVAFKIYKDCLPLPITTFRTAIKDNFQGAKFTPELNVYQVRDLLLLFSPIFAPSSALLHPPIATPSGPTEPHILHPTLAAEPRPWARPSAPNAVTGLQVRPIASERHLNPSLTRHNRYQPYRVGLLPNHSQQNTRPQFFQQNGLNPRSLQGPPVPVNPYQVVNNRPPYISNNVPYPRYMTMAEVNHVGHNGLVLQPVVNHVDTHHQGYNYDSPHLQTLPPYSVPAYGQPQPSYVQGPTVVDQSMPVLTHYSFAGGLLR
ncbi:uncharacterized protein [Rutidosis leptorrhynchoides]|uniref:uncharacterized protein isoform X2 n=1 Tax=Rutidosis leptorrhynchoides TaxID=125765 RepID=UPI003A9A03D1